MIGLHLNFDSLLHAFYFRAVADASEKDLIALGFQVNAYHWLW